MIFNLDFIKTTLVLCGFALFYFWSILDTPIYDETEGQYAGAVRVMDSYSEIPTNNEIPRLQKPPLTYWLMKFSASWIKNHEYAMRAPFIFALLGLLLTTYLIGLEVMDPSRGLAAMTLLGLSFGIIVFGRMVMPEILLSLFIALTFWSSLKALFSESQSTRELWWTLVWILMAFGSFAKGFHALFWPLIVFGIARGISLFQPENWRGFWSFKNGFLFLIITLPWYAAVEIQYPGYIWDNLWNEQVGHSLDFRFPPTYSRVSLLHYLFQHLFLLFPFILLVPHSFKYFSTAPDPSAKKQAQKLLLILPIVVLFTTLFSARQDYYTMASWFAIAIAVTVGSHLRIDSGWFNFHFWVLSALGVALLSLGMLWNGSAENLLRSDTTDHLFSIFTQLPIEIRPLFLISGATLLFGGGTGLLLCRQQRYSLIFLVYIISMSGPLWGTSKGVKILAHSFSLKHFAQIINANEPSWVVVDGPVPLASSLFYYLQERIYFVRANPLAEYATRRYGIGKEQYLDLESFLKHWESEKKIFFIIHEKDTEFWRKVLEGVFFEVESCQSGGRVLLKNHPL